MPYIILANISTPLEIINRAIAISYRVVSYPNGILYVSR